MIDKIHIGTVDRENGILRDFFQFMFQLHFIEKRHI